MKKFDLEKAKAGDKVVTRDGREVRIVCFDRAGKHPMIALVKNDDGAEGLVTFSLDGNCCFDGEETPLDLFMAPKVVKHQAHLVLYPCGAIEVYDEADKAIRVTNVHGAEYRLVEWEVEE